MIFKKIINFNIDDISRVKHDLHTFIDKEENWQSPPCPNRKNFIPESCNPECKDAATSLSIDPVLYPTERNVIAAVYGLNAPGYCKLSSPVKGICIMRKINYGRCIKFAIILKQPFIQNLSHHI